MEGNFIGRLDSGGYVVDSRANQPTIPGKDRKLQEQMESESSLCSPPSEDSEKVAVYSPGSGPSPKLDKTGTLISNFPVSKIVRNKLLLYIISVVA